MNPVAIIRIEAGGNRSFQSEGALPANTTGNDPAEDVCR